MKVFKVIFLGVVALLFIGSLSFAGYNLYVINTYQQAEGRIVDQIKSGSNRNSRGCTTTKKVIEIAENGMTRKITTQNGSCGFGHDTGDMVRILYDPANPESALIDDWSIWFPSGVLLFMSFGAGVVWLGIAHRIKTNLE
ncbi:MAG: hypothetical protein OHK0017_00450 [Patescibacteria group bacterium]